MCSSFQKLPADNFTAAHFRLARKYASGLEVAANTCRRPVSRSRAATPMVPSEQKKLSADSSVCSAFEQEESARAAHRLFAAGLDAAGKRIHTSAVPG